MGEPSSTSQERRSAPRAPLEVHIDLHTDSQFFAGFSQDLSDGGLFVATYSPAPVVTPEVHARVMNEVIMPTVRGMAAEGFEIAEDGQKSRDFSVTADGPGD